MKIIIRLRYHTSFGQTLFLCGDHEWFGGGQASERLAGGGLKEEEVDLIGLVECWFGYSHWKRGRHFIWSGRGDGLIR
jgi:hypothetical protein